MLRTKAPWTCESSGSNGWIQTQFSVRKNIVCVFLRGWCFSHRMIQEYLKQYAGIIFWSPEAIACWSRGCTGHMLTGCKSVYASEFATCLHARTFYAYILGMLRFSLTVTMFELVVDPQPKPALGTGIFGGGASQLIGVSQKWRKNGSERSLSMPTGDRLSECDVWNIMKNVDSKIDSDSQHLLFLIDDIGVMVFVIIIIIIIIIIISYRVSRFSLWNSNKPVVVSAFQHFSPVVFVFLNSPQRSQPTRLMNIEDSNVEKGNWETGKLL